MEHNSSSLILTSVKDLRNILRSEIEACLQKPALPEIIVQPVAELFSIQEAAKFLNLSVNTIYGLTSKNLIPFSKPGKKLYFNRQQLIEFVNQGKQKTVQELSQEVESHLHDQGKSRLQRT